LRSSFLHLLPLELVPCKHAHDHDWTEAYANDALRPAQVETSNCADSKGKACFEALDERFGCHSSDRFDVLLEDAGHDTWCTFLSVKPADLLVHGLCEKFDTQLASQLLTHPAEAGVIETDKHDDSDNDSYKLLENSVFIGLPLIAPLSCFVVDELQVGEAVSQGRETERLDS